MRNDAGASEKVEFGEAQNSEEYLRSGMQRHHVVSFHYEP